MLPLPQTLNNEIDETEAEMDNSVGPDMNGE